MKEKKLNSYEKRIAKEKQEKEEKNLKSERKKKKVTNKEFARVTYMFVALFLVLMGYIVYFNAIRSTQIINSPYNKRQDSFADRVVRGKILDKNGEILAETHISEDKTETRNYPYGEMFAHVIGYGTKGKAGIEAVENFSLLTSNAFFLEKIQKEFKDEKNTGDNVVTTLDANVQTAAYNALGNNNGAVVVLEANTGKVLAMASKPTFDPNQIDANWENLNSNESESALLNRATQGAYAPGSTFKVITALEYMRENPDFLNYRYQCNGEITYEGTTIKCFNGTVHGEVDLETSLVQSCNSSFANMGISLDKTEYRKVAESLLFNKKLPSVLPYRKSDFSVDKEVTTAEVMMTAMGQGKTQTNPYHMALITAAIANGGTLMKPYLVDSITNYSGTIVKKNMPESYRSLMTTEEANTLSTYMASVVTQGTATALSGAAYTVAGKTGTAEYSSDKEKSHSWFMGFTNVDNPELVISVIVEGSDGSSSGKAVPIAKKVLDAYYY